MFCFSLEIIETNNRSSFIVFLFSLCHRRMRSSLHFAASGCSDFLSSCFSAFVFMFLAILGPSPHRHGCIGRVVNVLFLFLYFFFVIYLLPSPLSAAIPYSSTLNRAMISSVALTPVATHYVWQPIACRLCMYAFVSVFVLFCLFFLFLFVLCLLFEYYLVTLYFT